VEPHIEREPQFDERIVFSSPLVRIGAFRCDRLHPSFPASAPIQHDCFWFSRTPVVIQPETTPAFVANQQSATFYNRSAVYARHPVGDHGDQSDWFGYDPDLLDEVLAHFPEPRRAGGRFPISHCPVDGATFLLQRQLFDAVALRPDVDPLAVEEISLILLDRVLTQAIGYGDAGPRRRQHRELAIETERLLSRHFDRPLTLAAIGAHVGASVFHLCRTFRRMTGSTLHQYLNRLRLRASLEQVSVSNSSLTEVALSLGFANHSHFTKAFRAEFDQAPSAFRAARGLLPPLVWRPVAGDAGDAGGEPARR